MLDFRPEVAQVVAPEQGFFGGNVCAAEMTGEQTLVTVQLGENTMTITMRKAFDIDIDSDVGIQSAPERGFVFDTTSGSRLSAQIVAPV